MKNFATISLEFIGHSLWGFRPNLMADIVKIHGKRKSLLWFVRNMPKYESILKKWGAERTHLLAVAISGLNGCPYCTYGHALAFQLHYFENHNQLFAIDEHQMMNFNLKKDQDVIQLLSQSYDAADLVQEKKDLQRFIVLRDSPENAQNEDDKAINHLVEMFGFLNACGIQKETKPDYAHDPIQKKSTLYHNYKKERAASNENLMVS